MVRGGARRPHARRKPLWLARARQDFRIRSPRLRLRLAQRGACGRGRRRSRWAFSASCAVGERGRRGYNRRLEDLGLTLILFLYAVTLFVGAALLFLVQPLVGKLLLPLVGGTPGVWNTCMVFFQAVLLAGYPMHPPRHGSASAAKPSSTSACSRCPLASSPSASARACCADDEDYPVFGCSLLLSLSVGLPSSSSAPPRRCSSAVPPPATRRPATRTSSTPPATPAASRAARLPALIEPRLHLRGVGWLSQHALGSRLLLLAVLIVAARWRCERSAAPTAAEPDAGVLGPRHAPRRRAAREPAPTGGRRLLWVALAFAPSSLLLGVHLRHH